MRIKREINIFLSAFLFFSRVKFPFKVDYKPENQKYLLTWFPALGYLVGGAGALAFWGAQLYLPQVVAAVLSVIVTVLLTGALHEDGLADVCDGFGGGYTKDRILDIMKDSLVGVYAIIGLLLMLSLKIAVLSTMPVVWAPVAILLSHLLSRWSVLGLTQTLPYARTTGASKSRDISQKLSWKRVLMISVVVLVPLYFLPLEMSASVLVVLLFMLWFRSFINKKIEGYTGDCLGALQQINEGLVLVLVLVLCGLEMI